MCALFGGRNAVGRNRRRDGGDRRGRGALIRAGLSMPSLRIGGGEVRTHPARESRATSSHGRATRRGAAEDREWIGEPGASLRIRARISERRRVVAHVVIGSNFSGTRSLRSTAPSSGTVTSNTPDSHLPLAAPA